VEVEDVLAVEEDALDECDDFPTGVVAGTHDGYVDHLKAVIPSDTNQ